MGAWYLGVTMGAMHVAGRLVRRARRELREAMWEVHGRVGREVSVETDQGTFVLPPNPKDPIGRHLYLYRAYELDFVTRALALLRDSGRCGPAGTGTILDVGANNGVISVGMLHRQEFARAVAIEPEPGNFAHLERNVAGNGLSERFVCRQVAAADEPGEITVELSETNAGDHRSRPRAPREIDAGVERFDESQRSTISVRAERIDDLLAGLPEPFSDIALVWIDVQGFEPHAFRGGRSLIQRGVPVVSEFWPYGMRRAGVEQAAFCELAGQFWSDYWVLRRRGFVRYPIVALDRLYEELGFDGDFESVIFTSK